MQNFPRTIPHVQPGRLISNRDTTGEIHDKFPSTAPFNWQSTAPRHHPTLRLGSGTAQWRVASWSHDEVGQPDPTQLGRCGRVPAARWVPSRQYSAGVGLASTIRLQVPKNTFSRCMEDGSSLGNVQFLQFGAPAARTPAKKYYINFRLFEYV